MIRRHAHVRALTCVVRNRKRVNMAGRPQLPINTFGSIRTTALGSRRYRAQTRFRDGDGRTRQVTAVGASRNAAQSALKVVLAARLQARGDGDSLTASSPFPALAQVWLGDVTRDVDRSPGTRDTYERQVRGLVLPVFEHFTVSEVTVGRIDRFLREQRAHSYPRSKHSRTILGMILAFAVRWGIIPHNPVADAARMKRHAHAPKALTTEQLGAIRLAAREWRTKDGQMGPRSDGQVRDIVEVMLGTATRIGEALALRPCDVDLDADPPQVNISGTIVVHNGVAVHRQEHPKTHESNRVIGVPQFAADVIHQRMALLDPEDAEHLLFYSRVNTPLTPHNVRRTFRGILRNAGLEGMDITPHSFRRTGATLLANELGIQAAADMLGHTSTSTTKAHYTEPDRRVMSEPAEVMQRLAPPP